MEVESNGQTPFLDVLLHHKADGSITTGVYRKATHTDRYLDFQSYHPVSHKRSVISTLLSRAGTHSSTPDLMRAESERVIRALKCNGYPGPLISQQVSRQNRGPLQRDDVEWHSSTVIPYVHGISEAIRHILRSR